MRKRHVRRIQSDDQGDFGECWEKSVKGVWRVLYLNSEQAREVPPVDGGDICTLVDWA